MQNSKNIKQLKNNIKVNYLLCKMSRFSLLRFPQFRIRHQRYNNSHRSILISPLMSRSILICFVHIQHRDQNLNQQILLTNFVVCHIVVEHMCRIHFPKNSATVAMAIQYLKLSTLYCILISNALPKRADIVVKHYLSRVQYSSNITYLNKTIAF